MSGDYDVRDKVAVITGAASGIGLGMARAFAGAGARLVLADIESGPLDATVAELTAAGAEAVGVRTDVSQLADIEALAEATMDTYGAVHVLCNNAGIGIPTPTHRLNLDDWRWMIDVDLWGPIYGVKVFLPLMEQQGEGHINSTSSLAGLVAGGMMGAYNVAKHGVVALMATLERDLRGRKSPVRASVLCPGPINTNISRHSVEYRPSKAKPKADGVAEGRAGSNIQSMLEQGMDPDEVGNLVLDAVQRDTFWVITHPRMIKLVTRQFDAMLNDGSLTKA
jgi:NAD(P)-dependent dehydrogenase (short-subunit alcohol dehydrogenase family)